MEVIFATYEELLGTSGVSGVHLMQHIRDRKLIITVTIATGMGTKRVIHSLRLDSSLAILKLQYYILSYIITCITNKHMLHLQCLHLV